MIHPKHVDAVNAAFMPTDEEIAWSERIVKAFNDNPTSGVVKIDGKMIDKPHLRAAEKISHCAGGRFDNLVARMSEAIPVHGIWFPGFRFMADATTGKRRPASNACRLPRELTLRRDRRQIRSTKIL